MLLSGSFHIIRYVALVSLSDVTDIQFFSYGALLGSELFQVCELKSCSLLNAYLQLLTF